MKLSACPCCGSQPTLQKVGGGDERCGYNFTMRISCQCGAAISRPSHQDKQGWCDDTGQAHADVIDAWNRRATLSQPALGADAEDARRYRWLRDVGDATWRPFGIREGYSAAQADAAIDAAIAQQKEQP